MRVFFSLIIGVFLAISVQAQYGIVEEKSAWHENFRFGGGFGLRLGSVTQIDLSPRIDYLVTDRWSFGVGGTYLYYNNKTRFYKTSIYGFGAFTDFALVKDLSSILPFGTGTALVLHAEANYLNLDPDMDFGAIPPRTDRFWIWQPMIGGGLKIPAGKRAYLQVLVLYNLNDLPYSPYANPTINVHIMF
ncbi:MAG: hypothetical protein PF448_07065 [Bacteroidales bacterium]|jgi:hypothetical protein|nr:hypothetical protein [Bacteroidales bacterium]